MGLTLLKLECMVIYLYCEYFLPLANYIKRGKIIGIGSGKKRSYYILTKTVELSKQVNKTGCLENSHGKSRDQI